MTKNNERIKIYEKEKFDAKRKHFAVMSDLVTIDVRKELGRRQYTIIFQGKPGEYLIIKSPYEIFQVTNLIKRHALCARKILCIASNFFLGPGATCLSKKFQGDFYQPI